MSLFDTRLRNQRVRYADLAEASFRAESGATEIPYFYGRSLQTGLLAFLATAADLTVETMTDAEQEFGTLESSADDDADFFALTQFVLGVGATGNVIALTVDGAEIQLASHLIRGGAYSADGSGSANPMATSFARLRNAASRFTGLSRLDLFWTYGGASNRTFSAMAPDVRVLAWGRKVGALVRAGAPGAYVYTYDRAAVTQYNAVTVLAEVMADLLDTEGIDAASFYAGQEFGSRIVQGAGSALWGEAFPAALNLLLGKSHATWSAYFTDMGYGAEADVPIRTAAIRRYEYNGELRLSSDPVSLVSLIMETMPGAILFHSGAWKLAVPDPAAPSGLTVDAKVIEWERQANVENRLSRVSIGFRDEVVLGGPGFAFWPYPGSYEDVAIRLQDSESREEHFEIPGVSSSAQATAIAATRVLQSRVEEWNLTLELDAETAALEPGEVITHDGTAIRIEEIEIAPPVVQVLGREWKPEHFHFQTNRNICVQGYREIGRETVFPEFTLSNDGYPYLKGAFRTPNGQSVIVGLRQVPRITENYGANSARIFAVTSAASPDAALTDAVSYAPGQDNAAERRFLIGAGASEAHILYRSGLGGNSGGRIRFERWNYVTDSVIQSAELLTGYRNNRQHGHWYDEANRTLYILRSISNATPQMGRVSVVGDSDNDSLRILGSAEIPPLSNYNVPGIPPLRHLTATDTHFLALDTDLRSLVIWRRDGTGARTLISIDSLGDLMVRSLQVIGDRCYIADDETRRVYVVRLCLDLAEPPVFAEDIGADRVWTAGIPIAAFTAPAAENPADVVYSIPAPLPDGIDFDAAAREFSGTPAAAGAGSIIMRATRPGGGALSESHWGFNYTTAAA